MEVHKRRPTAARELHKICEAFPNDEHNRVQEWASTPEGPAAPWVRKAATLIKSPVSPSNNTESNTGALALSGLRSESTKAG